MRVDVRAAEAADLPLLLELFRAAFRSEPDREEWIWKYERNPHRGVVSAIAVADGRAIGFWGALVTRYRGAKGNLPGAAAVDVMTHPEARRLGRLTVFQSVGRGFMTLNAKSDIPFDFGFPNERAGRAEERLLDVRMVEPAGELVRDVSGRRGRRRWLRRTARGGRFGAGDEPLVEAVHALPGWRTDRSPSTMNWRFFDRPGVSYDVFRRIDLTGTTRAWAVVRPVGDRAILVDLQAADEAGGELADLLDAVEEMVTTGSSPAVLRLAFRGGRTHPMYARLLTELGFVETPSDTCLGVRAMRPDVDPVAAGRLLDYRFADHEIF